MKVTGSAPPPIAGADGPEGPAKADAVGAGRRAEGPRNQESPGGSGPAGSRAAGPVGGSFSDKVAAAPGPKAATPPAAAIRAGEVAVRDLAQGLGAGSLDARAAVEKLIDRVVAAQVGPEAPAALRDKVRTALQDAVEGDPLLADKLRRLGS
jgi:hypothetical protein